MASCTTITKILPVTLNTRQGLVVSDHTTKAVAIA